MPKQPPSPFQQGLAAAEKGDFKAADAIAASLLSRNADDIYGHQLNGYSAFRQGDNQRALQSFLRANHAAPGQPAILSWIGVLYKERGDYVQAERAFRDTLRIAPANGEAWCNLGETLYLMNRKDEAKVAFDRAVAAEPGRSVVLSRAAHFFEITHDIDKARSFAERASAIDPADIVARLTLIELDLREKKYDAVLKAATPLLKQGGDATVDRNQARLQHMAATAHDRLGNAKTAYAHYCEANRIQAALNRDGADRARSPLQSVSLERVIGWLKSSDPGGWEKRPGLSGSAPVFLLGFVRSGTTWLDQILSSHPMATVMEEEDLLVDSWRDLLIDDTGLARLPSLSTEEIDNRRTAYWRRADSALKGLKKRPVVIDKLPLNTVILPLIWRLFPDSKIIFAVRDPRDVVFSAFQQHFQVNAGMAHFLDLKSAAEFYDRVMTIGSMMREKAPLTIHEIRYEDVVADIEGSIRGLLQFLNLEWTADVLNYQETARRRAVRTASAKQVIEKPFSSSIGKWRRYRDEMAPALPILAPWVRKFGYDPD